MSGGDRQFGPETQAAIYGRGLAGAKPEIPVAFSTLEAKAQSVLSDEAWAYIAGGAGREETAAANRTAFQSVHILPRMLAGAGVRAHALDLFGMRLAAPLLLAPIGVLEMAHPDADFAVARAAAALGLPMIISSQASRPMEEIAAANGGGARLFQLYWGREDAVAESFVRRAGACGCAAIVITLDTPILGWRPRDLAFGHLPFLHGRGIAQYVSDPAFRALLHAPPEHDMASAISTFIRIFGDPGLDWARISQIRNWTKLPVILKGIVSADDAARAVAAGFDGIIVSNHGGRQVDGAIGALAALPAVVDAVAGRAPVLFDSGVYGGADMFKALALGARAVCVGRPYVYGLALGGEAGVAATLTNMLAEFDLTMALAGVSGVADFGREMLART